MDIQRIRQSGKPALLLSSFTLLCGAGGMGISFLYLASASRLDVLAGVAGFVAGAVLVAAGLLSIAVLSRVPVAGMDQAIPGVPAFASPRLLRRWLAHFQRNRQNRPEPDWQAPTTLAPEVVAPLVRSLEQFQLGDGGGPACLIAWNAGRLRDSVAGARTLEALWFAEEREHARLLGAAVARFGGRCIDRHWSFAVFCWVRRWFGVRFELSVLLLTEIVSTVYYRLLRRHTADPAVRSMCRLILRDEGGHVAFHRDRLAGAQGRGYGFVWELGFRALGLAAASMLWVNHRPALQAVGASRTEFYGEVWRELSRFVRHLRRDVQKAAADGRVRVGPLNVVTT
jgi:hypothetical protein